MHFACLVQNSYSGQVTVNRSIFSKNKLPLVMGGYYGFAFCLTVNITIQVVDSIFHENQFQLIQGEFFISLSLSNCQFKQNIVHYGCLVKLYYYCPILIEKCSFVNNSVEHALGISVAINYRGSLILKDSIFLDNSGIDIGIIEVSNSFAHISNVLFGNNLAIVVGSCVAVSSEGRVQNKEFYVLWTVLWNCHHWGIWK